MKRLIEALQLAPIVAAFFVVSVALTSSCATTHRGRAAQVLAASDGMADSFSIAWSAFVDAKIDECRAKKLPTPDARAACLGLANETDAVEAAVQTLVAAQEAVRLAILEDRAEADWQALTRELESAARALLPYLKAARGE